MRKLTMALAGAAMMVLATTAAAVDMGSIVKAQVVLGQIDQVMKSTKKFRCFWIKAALN